MLARERAICLGERAAGRLPRPRRGAGRAAWMSNPPTTIAVREATVGPESGTNAVSCGAMSTDSKGTSSASATSCGKIVLVPCPISVEATRISIRPSAVSSTDATEARWTSPDPVNPAPCQASARPIPLASRSRPVRNGESGTIPAPARRPRAVPCRARSRSNSPASAARSRTSSPATLRAQDLAGRRRVADRVDVPSPDLERADPERLGDPVEVGLGGELGLWRAESTERAVRRRVRARRAGADPDVRAAIRAAGMDRAPRQDHGRQRAVGAAVHHDLDVLGDQAAVPGHAGPVADDRRVALGRGREVLVAVVDHPHRPTGLPGQQRRVQRDHRRVLLLATEPAAGLRLDDPRLAVVDGRGRA